MAFLMASPGQSFSRQELLRQVWGYDAPADVLDDTRTVDVHICWIRRALGQYRESIATVHPRTSMSGYAWIGGRNERTFAGSLIRSADGGPEPPPQVRFER